MPRHRRMAASRRPSHDRSPGPLRPPAPLPRHLPTGTAERCSCAWALPADGTIIAGQFIDRDLPEWWGARHAKRMYNATSSTNASHPDAQGRLCGPRQRSSPPPAPRACAGVQRPDTYLLARAQRQASPAQLASELGTTPTVVRHLLDQAGITPSPRRVTAAHTRRSSTDQHLAARAAELGFASLRAYLADRAMTRRWPTTSIASELGVHPATVWDRLDQQGLPRQRASVRPHRAIQRQRECWAAKRQARLAGLGFPDVEDYLRVRRVEQGWSLRRILAELQVGSAWLKDQLHRLGIP
jgi:hypothetical protein